MFVNEGIIRITVTGNHEVFHPDDTAFDFTNETLTVWYRFTEEVSNMLEVPTWFTVYSISIHLPSS